MFLQSFVKGTDRNNKEERRNGFQEHQQDQEDALPMREFVIFLKHFVKGTDGNDKEEKRNGLQELQ